MLDLGDVMSDRAAQREHGAYLTIVYDRDGESAYRARDILTTIVCSDRSLRNKKEPTDEIRDFEFFQR